MATQKLKVKPVTTLVHGVVFWPKVIPKNFYPSVYAWAEAGTPSDAWVYDSVDTLTACRIKIVDATYYRGVFTRLPTVRPTTKESKVIFPVVLMVPIKPAHVKDVLKGIKGANTKAYNKLNYG